MNLEPLDQIHVEIKKLWPSNRGVTECSKFAGLRIHQDDLAIGTLDRPVRVPRYKTIAGRCGCSAGRGDTGKAWVSDLLESIEVNASTLALRPFAHVLSTCSDDIRRSRSGLPGNTGGLHTRSSGVCTGACSHRARREI